MITQSMPGVVIMVVWSIQWMLRCVEQSGEMGAVIHEWQFVNQAERRQKDRCQASVSGEEWLRLSCLSNCALKSTEQVAAFCRSLHEMKPSDPSPSPQDSTGPQLAAMRQLTDADKLRKVICELLETERTYVKVRLPPSLLRASGCHWGMHAGCLYTDVGWWQSQSTAMKGVLSLLWNWPWFWMLQFPSVF